MIGFEVHGIARPQGSKRLVGGRMIEADGGLQPWRDSITWEARQHLPNHWDPSGPFRVELIFTFVRPKAHFRVSGLIKPSAPVWKSTRPDVDKLARAALDAITAAGIWLDDAQVVSLLCGKVWGNAPLLTVTIRKMAEPPLTQGDPA